LQNKNKCPPFEFDLFSLYPGQLNFGQTVWDKTQVLLGTSWGTHLRTWWEHAENALGTRERYKKIIPPTPPRKGKNSVHHECMLSLPIDCTEFLFLKLFVTIFWPGLMAGAEIWGHSYESNLVHLYSICINVLVLETVQ
jgi:hypothetical protein